MDETLANDEIEDVPITDEHIEMNFRKLENRIDNVFEINETKVRRINWQRFSWIAACLACTLLIAGLALYTGSPPEMIVQETPFGKIRTVALPDGSTVTLNGNSKITYKNDWNSSGKRYLELEGEAFFKVMKTADQRKFTVKMRNAGEIEVLGTEFNVNHRPSGSRIVLRSGSIRLHPEDNTNKAVIMKPGQLVEIRNKKPKFTDKLVNPAVYDTWTKRKLVFENTTFKEIAAMLKETYDLDVTVSNPELLEKTISGTAPINDIDIFLKALSGSFDLKINRNQNKITITPN